MHSFQADAEAQVKGFIVMTECQRWKTRIVNKDNKDAGNNGVLAGVHV
jgi:hypothetical protein